MKRLIVQETIQSNKAEFNSDFEMAEMGYENRSFPLFAGRGEGGWKWYSFPTDWIININFEHVARRKLFDDGDFVSISFGSEGEHYKTVNEGMEGGEFMGKWAEGSFTDKGVSAGRFPEETEMVRSEKLISGLWRGKNLSWIEEIHNYIKYSDEK